MAIVLINGDVTGVVHAANTWGELLDVLDQERTVSGDVVTGVRLDGVDTPAFRSADALARTISADAEIYIETTRPADLIESTLDEAQTVSAAIVDAALCLGGSFRGKDIAGANRALPAFADSLGSLIVATSAVAQGIGADLSVIGDGRISAIEMINNLIAHADSLLSAQLAHDWTRVADVIEYDIAGAVRRWPTVLQGIREHVPVAESSAA